MKMSLKNFTTVQQTCKTECNDSYQVFQRREIPDFTPNAIGHP